ncbi:MAG: hypothetical protein GY756_04550 [bacterium]|nr:hypothetical protein [bacterium]
MSSDNILLSAENVQTMIDNAENGDTITLPSGTAVWVSTVSVPDDKEITIQGSGNQSTIIGSELIIDYTYVILR